MGDDAGRARARALLILLTTGLALAAIVMVGSGAQVQEDPAARPPRPTSSSTSTTAPTTTTTEPPGDECGVQPTKPDGTPWACTFHDDFDGPTLDEDNWLVLSTATSGFRNGEECFVDSPENVDVEDGSLFLTVREEDEPFLCDDPHGEDFETSYSAASLSTFGRFSQTYGRFEVRARYPAPGVPGLHEAFWLWPVDPLKYGPWPISGEIDVAEGYSLHSDRMIPYIHYWPNGWDWNVTNNWCVVGDVSDWHTYTAEWTEDAITISYDGEVCIHDEWDPAPPLEEPQPFDHPFIVVLTQALGIGGNAFDPEVTPLPGTSEIDYVRVWE